MSIREAAPETTPPLELWGGVECTVNRVRGEYYDQTVLTGHQRRDDDLARVAALGIRRLRYPVLWERVAPQGLASADWAWTDARLSALRSHGIDPIAGLVHHGSGPPYASLLDEHFPEAFAQYAAAVARRYPWIERFTPVNEPLTTARFAALYGHWHPHEACDAAFVKALLNQCRAVALAMEAIRTITPHAALIQTDDAGKTYSTQPLAYQAAFENERRWLAWDLVCGRVNRQHPLWPYLRRHGASVGELGWFVDHACPPDIIGLNYYVTSDRFLDHRVGRYAPELCGGNGRQAYADVEAVRACRGISGHAAVLQEAWERYRIPVAITEVHLGCSREEQMRWLVEAWNAAHASRRAGAAIRAVTAWALFGLSDWDTLVTRMNGHYEPSAFDVRGPEPRPTALARVIVDLGAGRQPAHPVLADDGWWRRETRLYRVAGAAYSPDVAPMPSTMRTVARLAPRRPLVIVGAGGTLGDAFTRICGIRGLHHHALVRSDLDIGSGAAIAAALEALQPWAVINAAGYVRVDDAEREPDECRRVNEEGPALLAEACDARGIRFVTFSSDLVFDGRTSRPYVESDSVAPLNVYGCSKAAAEAAVQERCGAALVVRTGAFFGPWDCWNAVHVALEALDSGRRWRPAVQQRVSPTYVPDLVNATLDLLIDGASGLWHLANEGDVSWAELIRKAAALAHFPDLHIDDAAEPAPHAPARPAYSVLASERGQLLRPLDDALRRFFVDREADRTSAGRRPGTAA